MNCKMTLFVYPATTTTHLSQGVAVRHSNTHSHTHTATHTCISLCAHLLNSSFQVSFSDMLFVLVVVFPQLGLCLLLRHSPESCCVCAISFSHTHTRTHTNTQQSGQSNKPYSLLHYCAYTAYSPDLPPYLSLHPVLRAETLLGCAALLRLAIYLPRLIVGKLINNFVKFQGKNNRNNKKK